MNTTDAITKLDSLMTKVLRVEYVIIDDDNGAWEIDVSPYPEWERRNNIEKSRKWRTYRGAFLGDAMANAVKGEFKS